MEVEIRQQQMIMLRADPTEFSVLECKAEDEGLTLKEYFERIIQRLLAS